jgi:hypothetical protein
MKDKYLASSSLGNRFLSLTSIGAYVESQLLGNRHGSDKAFRYHETVEDKLDIFSLKSMKK